MAAIIFLMAGCIGFKTIEKNAYPSVDLSVMACTSKCR
jgi:multidrug efflux pump subunit AcrB